MLDKVPTTRGAVGAGDNCDYAERPDEALAWAVRIVRYTDKDKSDTDAKYCEAEQEKDESIASNLATLNIAVNFHGRFSLLKNVN